MSILDLTQSLARGVMALVVAELINGVRLFGCPAAGLVSLF